MFELKNIKTIPGKVVDRIFRKTTKSNDEFIKEDDLLWVKFWDKVISGMHEIKDFRPKRAIKFLKQRIKRGFDDSELWSLDSTLTKFLLPRIKAFKDMTMSHPGTVTEEEWYEILDDIIYSLESFKNECEFWETEKLDRERYDRGFRYLGEYYRDLWS